MTESVKSLYLHFPHCRHLCNYCDFYKNLINDRSQQIPQFHELLEQQISSLKSLHQQNQIKMDALDSFYIGGGTPSLWGSDGASFIKNLFKENNIELKPQGEHTLEVNPGTWNAQMIQNWIDIGMNRFSVGMQTLDRKLIKHIDRVHSIEDSLNSLKFFKELGVNFSVDLMLGLPDSENRDIKAELDQVLEYAPDHISLYILTVKPQYIHYKNLPSEELIEREFLFVSDYLKKFDYLHYEVSNFSKRGRESLHNLNYWKTQSVAALGPSATGLIRFKKSGLRYKWKTQSLGYETEILDEEALHLESVYMRLRTNLGLKLSEFVRDPREIKVVKKLVDEWMEQGLAIESNPVRLSAKGYLLLDSLLGQLFNLVKSI